MVTTCDGTPQTYSVTGGLVEHSLVVDWEVFEPRKEAGNQLNLLFFQLKDTQSCGLTLWGGGGGGGRGKGSGTHSAQYTEK